MIAHQKENAVKKSTLGLALAATGFSGVLAASLIVRAQDAPTTEPEKHAAVRLEQPYSKIADLTDDEKSKIEAIHKKALDDARILRAKEDEDIRAVLTDDQKAELDKIIADKREKAEEKAKEKKAAATEPAAG